MTTATFQSDRRLPIERVAAAFTRLGGEFVTPPAALAERLGRVRALLFDWDGVFNDGRKGESASAFSEADSMGTNLLRYALWRRDGTLPFAAIVTGEDNPGALRFAEREHFDRVCSGVRDKARLVRELLAEREMGGEDVACVFDDVNDLGMARQCGVRVMVRRRESPMLAGHVVADGLADYVTASPSGGHAVREAAELMLGLLGAFGTVVSSRVAVDDAYQRYFDERQAVQTRHQRGSGEPTSGRRRDGTSSEK